jgi:hypothetical protein
MSQAASASRRRFWSVKPFDKSGKLFHRGALNSTLVLTFTFCLAHSCTHLAFQVDDTNAYRFGLL